MNRIEIKTDIFQVTVSSFELDNDKLLPIATAVGVALAMVLKTNHVPFVVMNEWDKLDGYNCTVSCGKDRRVQ